MSPDVAIIVPTIPGRESHLAWCLAAYEQTAPAARVYVEHDHPSCGAAWLAGAARADADGFAYLHLTADDLEPRAGWLEIATETVDAGYIPAPVVRHPGGELESAGLHGFGCYTGPHTDWQLIDGTTIPFLTLAMWRAIGMIDVHYCTDLWVSTIGRRHGWETAIRTGMRFTHHTASAGRNHARSGADTDAYLRRVAEVTA